MPSKNIYLNSLIRFIFYLISFRCFLYLKLLLLGGFTWIFEVLSYTYNDHSPSAWFWVIIDSLNCLHGVLVFCVLILWRRRIRKELSKQKILGIRWPSSWANIDDDEEEEVCLENEGNKTDSTFPTNIITNWFYCVMFVQSKQ